MPLNGLGLFRLPRSVNPLCGALGRRRDEVAAGGLAVVRVEVTRGTFRFALKSFSPLFQFSCTVFEFYRPA